MKKGFKRACTLRTATDQSSTTDMACSDNRKRMCTEMTEVLSLVRETKKRLYEIEVRLCEFLEQEDKEQDNHMDQHQETDDERASPILSFGPLANFNLNRKKSDDEQQRTAEEKEAPNNMWCEKHGDFCANGECSE